LLSNKIAGDKMNAEKNDCGFDCHGELGAHMDCPIHGAQPHFIKANSPKESIRKELTARIIFMKECAQIIDHEGLKANLFVEGYLKELGLNYSKYYVMYSMETK
jgi:hypothetical protein